MKRIVSLMLSALLLISALPFASMSAFAVMDEFDISYTLSSDGTYYSVTDYYGDADHVTIPSTFNGLPVTRIGYEAFRFAEIKTVTIPSSITYIADSAFARCDWLETVTVPDSVTYVGSSAFNSCPRLKSVTLPSGLTKINTMMFRFCESLESITIPSGVTVIEANVFEGCTSLTSVTIPDAVTTFYSGPFKNCTALKTVSVGKSLTNLSRYAFEGCTSLESVTVSKDNARFKGDGSYVVDVDAGSLIMGFGNCSIPSDGSVTMIGSYAFMDATNLTEITIPATIKSIGYEAFKNCTSLSSITIPETVRIMNTLIFAYSSLTDIYCEADTKPPMWDDSWISYCSATVHWNSDNKKDKPYGDLNSDEDITVADLLIYDRIIDGEYSLDSSLTEIADLNCDGSVSYEDRNILESIYLSDMSSQPSHEGDAEFGLTVEAPESYKKGDIVEVKVSLDNITAENGLHIFGFECEYDNTSLRLVNEAGGTGLECGSVLYDGWKNLSKVSLVSSGSYTNPANDGKIICSLYTDDLSYAVYEDGCIVLVFIFIALSDSSGNYFTVTDDSAYAAHYSDDNIIYYSCKNIAYINGVVNNVRDESFSGNYTTSDYPIYDYDQYKNGKKVYFAGNTDSERILTAGEVGIVFIFIVNADGNIISFGRVTDMSSDFSAVIPAGGFALSFYYDEANPENWWLYNLFIYLVNQYNDEIMPENTAVNCETEAMITQSYSNINAYYVDNRTGDVDLEDNIDSVDYLMVKRYYFNTLTLNAGQKARADVDKNGVIDQYDYVCLKRAYFGTYEIK